MADKNAKTFMSLDNEVPVKKRKTGCIEPDQSHSELDTECATPSQTVTVTDSGGSSTLTTVAPGKRVPEWHSAQDALL